MLGEGPVEKRAVELNPDTAAALGGPSPEQLDQLEQAAASSPPPASDDEQVATPDAAPTEAPPVDGFDRVDEEPDPDDESLAAAPELPSRMTHGKLFTDKRAHPLQLLDVLTLRYKTAWADWEPETLWWALRRDFGPVGDLVRNKIMALRVAVTTDTPWLDWDNFEDVGLTFNDVVPVIGQFQPMNSMQMAFAVDVLREIRSDETFDDEVKAYIAALLEEGGWVYAPEEYFGPAQELLDRRVWMLTLKDQIQTTWEHVQNVDPATIEWREDNPVDVQVLRLFAVKRYLQERAHLRVSVPGAPATASTASPPVP
jgi:hypothetical protein